MGVALLPIADSSAPIYAKPVLCLQFNKFTTRFTNDILKEQGAE